MEDWSRLAEVLNKELGLTPYESRAYVSLMIYGSMSPSELAQRADIPRPRAYDVLRNLVEKGLLTVQSGKPSIYAALEPSHGLKNLIIAKEMETFRELEEKRKAAKTLAKSLSELYEKSKDTRLERSRVWLTRRDTAFIAIYNEAIRNCEKELLVASTDPYPPEKEVLEAVEYALKRGRSARVVRQITKSWTKEDLRRYEEVVKAGSQVRYLDIDQILLRFAVFDRRDVILVLPSDSEGITKQALEALWLRIPPLAEILCEHFEQLWKKGKPILPILKEIEDEIRRSSANRDKRR